MPLQYVIWNVKPQLVDFGGFEIRYYSILFAMGFVFGYMILSAIFKKKGVKPELLDKLTVYMVISTIIGARLGHCLFYEFDYYIQHPLEMILPWRVSPDNGFEFTGFQGLASHGAAIGILLGIYLFSRKTKAGYLWTMDLLVIVAALGGSFIRLGNLMNSEIYGMPVANNSGFVFVRDATDLIERKYTGTIARVSFAKSSQDKVKPAQVPIQMQVAFERKIRDEILAQQYMATIIERDLQIYDFNGNLFPPDQLPADYPVMKTNRSLVLSAPVLGVPRHPSQIYEAVSYLLIFLFLLVLYLRLDNRIRDGFFLGLFLVLVFTARFFIEFLKENQETFEDSMALNMGQWLSIPFVLVGLFLTIRKWPLPKS